MAMQLAIHLLDLENNRAFRRERVFRDRSNPFDTDDDLTMFRLYRFTRIGCSHIIDRLTPRLQHPTRRNHALSPCLQVFIALRFYATGEILTSNMKTIGCSTSTGSRALRRVTLALVRLRDQHIKFPTTRAEVRRTQQEFFDVAGFPRVVGAIDGTQVGLHGCPYGPDEHIYVNRKGKHSINVQLICNARYKIINVVARWPGSTHDSRILSNSRVGQLFENGDLQGILLGDSGYPLQPWLMTPFLNPATPEEVAYNE